MKTNVVGVLDRRRTSVDKLVVRNNTIQTVVWWRKLVRSSQRHGFIARKIPVHDSFCRCNMWLQVKEADFL